MPIERMRIDPNGNVGIGTTSPGAKLDVNGNIQMTVGSYFSDGGFGRIQSIRQQI